MGLVIGFFSNAVITLITWLHMNMCFHIFMQWKCFSTLVSLKCFLIFKAISEYLKDDGSYRHLKDDERDLVTKIEPFEEDVAEENPPHDWERSWHQNRTFHAKSGGPNLKNDWVMANYPKSFVSIFLISISQTNKILSKLNTKHNLLF